MKPTDPQPQDSPSSSLSRPLPPPPRIVRRCPGRGWLLGHVPLLVWLLGFVGVGLLLLSLGVLVSSWLVARFGATVPGKITGKSAAEPQPTTASRVQFTYQVGEQEYASEDTVDGNAFARLFVGAPVQVKVLPMWPRQPQLQEPGGQAGGNASCLLFLALLWNGTLGVVLWVRLRKPWRQRGLVREGLATGGTIVRKEVGRGEALSWHVHYCYQAPTHGLDTGVLAAGTAEVSTREWQVIMAVGQQDFEAVEVGTAVTVLYDPQQPAHSLIYPFAEYEAVVASAEETPSA